MDAANEAPPATMVAGALAHLARHVETGCPQAARLAAMLLERVASDPDANEHLRIHARELVEILERDDHRVDAAGVHGVGMGRRDGTRGTQQPMGFV